MESTRSPPPQLRHLVKSFHTHHEVHTPATSEHRLLPGTTVGLCFFRGHAWREEANGLRCVSPVYVDYARVPGRLVVLGRSRIVGVELHLWGAIRLFGPRFERDLAVPATTAARVARLLAHDEAEEAADV